MPFYENLCEKCGRESELLQRMSEPPATECPHCHASGLVKQVSAAGFRLKGGGWYETDFKSDSKRNLAAESDGTKSEPKPDAETAKSHSCAAGACGCAPKTSTPSPAAS